MGAPCALTPFGDAGEQSETERARLLFLPNNGRTFVWLSEIEQMNLLVSPKSDVSLDKICGGRVHRSYKLVRSLHQKNPK